MVDHIAIQILIHHIMEVQVDLVEVVMVEVADLDPIPDQQVVVVTKVMESTPHVQQTTQVRK